MMIIKSSFSFNYLQSLNKRTNLNSNYHYLNHCVWLNNAKHSVFNLVQRLSKNQKNWHKDLTKHFKIPSIINLRTLAIRELAWNHEYSHNYLVISYDHLVFSKIIVPLNIHLFNIESFFVLTCWNRQTLWIYFWLFSIDTALWDWAICHSSSIP